MAVQFLKPLAFVLAFIPLASFAQEHGHGGDTNPYAGFETREIKSLSQQDIEELKRGGGWGLALPAELNGRPGPVHLLELREELELSSDQVDAISAAYEEMRAAAIEAGEKFIAAEAALDDAFAGSGISEKALRILLDEAAKARAELRFIHLSQHLSMPEILSDAQIKKYNVKRGYLKDPCESVPEGHDPNMWRRHNGCDN